MAKMPQIDVLITEERTGTGVGSVTNTGSQTFSRLGLQADLDRDLIVLLLFFTQLDCDSSAEAVTVKKLLLGFTEVGM